MDKRRRLFAGSVLLLAVFSLSNLSMVSAAETNGDDIVRITLPDGTVKTMDLATYEAYFGAPAQSDAWDSPAADTAAVAQGANRQDKAAGEEFWGLQSFGGAPVLHQAKTREDPAAQVKLGYQYYNQRDYAQAVAWFRKAAEQGNAEAQYSMGVLYADGKGVSRDHYQAALWYHKAAEQGYARAQYYLADTYYSGRDVSQDYSQAAYWYGQAAEQGHAESQNMLGFLYEHGRGVAQSHVQAAHWYQKAADQGYRTGQHNLGLLYYNGKGVNQDYAKAAELFRKAAEQGVDGSQNMLAMQYRDGEGVPRDYAQAAYWFEKAAEQGIADAQNNIGYLYRTGNGVPQDNYKAAEWYRKAAEQNHAAAQNNLGYMYRNGLGVSQNFDEAAKWYAQAIANGDEQARQNLATLQASTGRSFQTGIEPDQGGMSYYRQQPAQLSPQDEIEAYKREVAQEYGLQLDANGEFIESDFVKNNRYYGIWGRHERNMPQWGLE